MSKISRKDSIKITNAFVAIHDLKCECDEPAVHSLKILLKQLEPELTSQQKQEIKKCLGTTTVQEEEDGGVTGEDLERIFAEDTGETDG